MALYQVREPQLLQASVTAMHDWLSLQGNVTAMNAWFDRMQWDMYMGMQSFNEHDD